MANNPPLTITVLGCGNSSGVPAIGNYWGECDPTEPKNLRTRTSIAVRSYETTLIIDTGPDFKEQMNREKISNLDAVLYTHHHSDHVMGIEELRIIKFRNQKEYVPIYGNAYTLNDLERRFDYLFKGGAHAIYPPILKSNTIKESAFGTNLIIGDIHFVPFEQDHGTCKSLGYRFDDFAYSVDILDLDEAAIHTLKGIKTWLVDCAAYHNDENAVHAGLNKIIALNDTINADKVLLTSLSLSMDYQTLIKELPSHIIPAYDGMII